MLGPQLVLLLTLFAVSTFAPGFYLTRRFHLAPLERLCLSVALSVVFLYLLSFAIWVLHGGKMWHVAISAAFLGIAAVDARSIGRFFRLREIRRAIGGFLFLLVWGLAALALVRGFGGGGWFGDWFEHYQRTEVFLGRLSDTATLFGNYALPARPPLANLLVSHYLAQVGDRFELFQVCLLTFNLLVFFPCCLLGGALGGRNRRLALTLAALLALNPFFVQNATYSWTKLLATFFVMLAVALYLRGWRRRDPTRTVLAFVSLTAGLLTHYLVGPYLVFLAGHALWRLFRHRDIGWRTLVGAAASSVTLFATWVAWSVTRFGAASTVLSNTSVAGIEDRTMLRNALRIASNLLATVVPHPFRAVSLSYFAQASPLGRLRDWAFLICQTNAIVAMGSVGGLLALWFLCHAMRSSSCGWQRSAARFWLGLIATSFVLGVAVVASREATGLAHICLAPLVLCGVTLVATCYRSLGPAGRALAAVGLAADFALGIALQLGLENIDLSQPALEPTSGSGALRPPLLAIPAIANWRLKASAGLVFLGDHVPGGAMAIEVLMAAVAVALILWLTLSRQAGDGRRPTASQSPTGTT